MKNLKYLIGISVMLLGVSLVPIFKVEVIPEWSFSLVDDNGQPVVGESVDQRWKDYSYEFFRSREHVDQSEPSDAYGRITLPERGIAVSALQILIVKLRDVVAMVNPHSGSGPRAYILCRDSAICRASYTGGNPLPTKVVVRR